MDACSAPFGDAQSAGSSLEYSAKKPMKNKFGNSSKHSERGRGLSRPSNTSPELARWRKAHGIVLELLAKMRVGEAKEGIAKSDYIRTWLCLLFVCPAGPF